MGAGFREMLTLLRNSVGAVGEVMLAATARPAEVGGAVAGVIRLVEGPASSSQLLLRGKVLPSNCCLRLCDSSRSCKVEPGAKVSGRPTKAHTFRVHIKLTLRLIRGPVSGMVEKVMSSGFDTGLVDSSSLGSVMKVGTHWRRLGNVKDI